MLRQPPRSTHCISSAASDVYKRQTYSSPSSSPVHSQVFHSSKQQQQNLNLHDLQQTDPLPYSFTISDLQRGHLVEQLQQEQVPHSVPQSVFDKKRIIKIQINIQQSG
eukprot:TRINITY_DN4467_c0_g1_i2.p3 TRINITY_DN4467_c0_g1~~TRINITY_DN4467_c0_g1_i2.p3  ORF type:complete len:108 (-),score=20.12 TRINITY_DN4467_c0_g1_i2:139-462(-)